MDTGNGKFESKYERPTDEELLKGIEEHGTIKDYAEAINVPRTTVNYWVKLAKKNESLRHVSEKGGAYIQFKDGSERFFTEEEINDYFLAFSSKGRDLNTRQMLNEFGLTPMEWHKIKNMFKIYKLSNIFWDKTLNKLPPSQREGAIEERLGVAFDNTNKMVDRAYTKALQGNLKKQITANAFAQEYLKEFFACLAESDSQLPVTEVVYTKGKRHTNPALVACVSDIHIGAHNVNMQGKSIHNTEIIRKHLETVAHGINRRQSKEVTLLLNGDLIESFTGLMHGNTFQDMERQATYANSIILARNVLVEFIGQVANVKRICVISGNHDRMSSKYSEDPLGGVACILAEFLKLYFPKTKVDWSPLVLKHERDGICYLFTHGHKKFVEKDFYKIILDHGNPDMYNVVIIGHFHNRQIKHDNSKGRLIILPSIAQGGSFAQDHGFNATPGYALFEGHEGKLSHTDIVL